MLPTRESIFAMFEFIHFLQDFFFFYLRHNVNFFQNTTSPSFNMVYVFGNENVEVGTATRAQLEITTNRSVSYPMMNMEFIMPLGNTSTKLSICRARMLSAGRNLPCVAPDWINSQVIYQSQ